MPSKLTSRIRLAKRTISFCGWHCTGDIGPWTAYTTRTARLVLFPRSPPLNPPTAWQLAGRQKFRDVAIAWHDLSKHKRANWRKIARRASLSIGGYSLFTFWTITKRTDLIQTLERQTNIYVLP